LEDILNKERGFKKGEIPESVQEYFLLFPAIETAKEIKERLGFRQVMHFSCHSFVHIFV